MRIRADRSACIGSGMCVMSAPAVFDQDDAEGLVVVLQEEPAGDDGRAALEAVSLCPVHALGADQRSSAEQPR